MSSSLAIRHSHRTHKGLQMIDPTSAVIDKRIFMPISISQPNIGKLSQRQKKHLSKEVLKQKEEYWSTDNHIKYVPYSNDLLNHPSSKSDKPNGHRRFQSHVELETSQRSRTPNKPISSANIQKNKQRIIINLDERFNTKAKDSVTYPNELHTSETQDSIKEEQIKKTRTESASNVNYILYPKTNAKKIEGQKKLDINIEDQQHQVKHQHNKSTTDIPQSKQGGSYVSKSFHIHGVKPQTSKSQHRDLLEVSQLYLKNQNDVQAIADRLKMIEEIRRGNAKRAAVLEQMRRDNIKKISSSKPVFFGREYCYKQFNKNNKNWRQDGANFQRGNGYIGISDQLSPNSANFNIAKNQALYNKPINLEKVRKFRNAVNLFIIVKQFWKAIDKAIKKKRQLKIDTFSVNLKDSISTCMKFTLQAGQQPFLKLFKETENLAYYTHPQEDQAFNNKKAKIRQHCINIMTQIAAKSSNLEKDFSFIKLIAKNANNFEFPPQNFWPRFIIDRVEFTKMGSLKNLTANQREMIALLFFVLYGLFNRLVRPWTTLQLNQSEELAKNSQVALSLIFYSLHDYLKEKNPKIVNNFKNVSQQYHLKERDAPLNAYPELTLQDSENSLNTKKPESSSKAQAKLDLQKKENDNIIMGITSRNKLLDLLEKDAEFKEIMRGSFAEISKQILEKADQVYPEVRDKLLNLI